MAKLVRGFRDIFEPQSKNFTELENCARGVFSLYGFGELRLPTVELKELFIKSTGETTDIVQKEMYAFEDAGHRQLAIRPKAPPVWCVHIWKIILRKMRPSKSFITLVICSAQNAPRRAATASLNKLAQNISATLPRPLMPKLF